MDGDPARVAQRLLEAQVDFVLAELSGERLAQVIARDVDDVLAIAGSLTLRDIADPQDVKLAARTVLDTVLGSAVVEDMTGAVSDALYDLAAGDDYRLGDVVDREPVSALIAKLLAMRQLQDRLLDRLTESPLVATVASRFVTKIVADFLQQNRARAEKLPGMASLFSLGSTAASRVRSTTVDQFLGDAAGRGAQYALRRTNNTVRELLADAPIHGAAMEMWDLHADEPIGALREYLTKADLHELVLLVRDVALSARDSDYAVQVLHTGIDVFFERYGDHDVATLLTELGIERDTVVADLQRLLPPVVEAAKADGRLAAEIRTRLAPFFDSDTVIRILRD
jgi:hypothetical protein